MEQDYNVLLADDFVRDDEIEDLEGWDGSYTPPAQGTYLVRVDSAERKPSKSSGKPMIEVHYKIIGRADGKPTPEEGRQVRAYYTMVEKGKKRLKAFLSAVKAIENGGYRVSTLPGRQLIIDVGHEAGQYTDVETGVTRDTVNVRVSGERAAQ